jgi:hypothetical protein
MPMLGFGEALILTAISTAASVGASIDNARRAKAVAEYQNRQQKSAYEKSKAVNEAQSSIMAADKRKQIQARYDAYRAASKTAAAERGVSTSQSSAAIVNAFGFQAAQESAKVSMQESLGMQNFAISNMPQWQVGQSGSALFAGIQGGLQGLSLGLSYQSASSANAAANRQAGIGTTIPEAPGGGAGLGS